MPAFCTQFGTLAFTGNSILGKIDRCCGLKCHSQVDGFTITNAALNATRTVRIGSNATIFSVKTIIVFRSTHQHRIEAKAKFNTTSRWK